MKKLLEFLLDNITETKNYKIEETKEGDKITFDVKSDPENMGLIIGKNGNTIKAIQNVLRVRARLKNVSVFINVSEAK